MKKAFLVSFSPMTRVVVDVDDKSIFPANDEEWNKVVRAAREQMTDNNIADYISGETVDEIILDEDLPYPQEFDI